MRSATLFVFALIVLSSAAKADQYASGSQVVHSRRAPVIAHKVVPPFKGVHVYQGRTPRR